MSLKCLPAIVAVAACGYALSAPLQVGTPLPPLLSQTGAFTDLRTLAPSPALLPYELIVPFWSDGAAKRRWVAVPPGQRVHFAPTGEWSFPAGTVFVKHFELPAADARPAVRLETRLLVRDAAGGVLGASYRWRADNSDADLVMEARTEAFAGGRRWFFPGVDDCRKCHLPAVGGVLGPSTRQMNRDGPAGNQVRDWSRRGLLNPPPADHDVIGLAKLAADDDRTRSVEDRARSYLDVNCGYCHRPGGAVADFDARYDTSLVKQLLVNVPARINFGVDRARYVAPNDVWRSMLLVRTETLEPTKMPPLGHETVDRHGADLLREWIASLPGPPVLAPPAIEPKGGDLRTAAHVTLRHADPSAVVRYTLDGLPPTAASPAYREPLELRESATVRARAFRTGHTPSITVQETFIVGN